MRRLQSSLPHQTWGRSVDDLKDYLALKPTPTYVWDMTEVDYQRKGLTDEGWPFYRIIAPIAWITTKSKP